MPTAFSSSNILDHTNSSNRNSLLSEMKIYTSLKWVLLSLAILLICSHSHANQTPFSTDHDSQLPNKTYPLGTQPTKTKHIQVKLTPPVVISSVLCFIAASISNAGGIGGGGLFIAILTLVGGLDLKTATSYSAFMVTGGSSANVIYHMISASRKYGAKSLVDYDISFLSEPVMLLGVSIGVLCNVMFPDWLISILCSAFLAWSTYKTFKCGVRKWKLETKERKKKGHGETRNGLVEIEGNCDGNGVEINKESGLSGNVVELENGLVGVDGNCGGNEVETEKESSSSGKAVELENALEGVVENYGGNGMKINNENGLGGNVVEFESRLAVGHGGNFGGNGMLETNKVVSGFSGKTVESCKNKGIQWKKLGGLMVIWFSFFVLRLFTGNRHGEGIKLVKPCGVGYWILSSMQIPLALSFTSWILYKRGSRHQTSNHQEKEEQTRGEQSRELVFPVIAWLAGALGGVFGVGGGMLLSPFFLQLGLAPEVAAATCSLLVLLSSFMSAIQYFLLGMDLQHLYGALALAFICFSASVIGLMVIKKAIRTYDRASLIVFSVAIVIAVSTVLIPSYGALNAWRDYKSGRYMGFKRPC